MQRDRQLHSDYTTLKMRIRHKRLKQRAVDYKGGKCETCGYDKCLSALEFHHTDPNEKDFGIASSTRSWESVKAELIKCKMLCSNCHREEHERLTDSKHEELTVKVREVIPERPPGLKAVSHYCLVCKKVFETDEPERKFCSTLCTHKDQEVTSWPSDSELAQIVWQMPVSAVAKQLNVSDKAISKRCKLRGIETPGRGYWQRQRVYNSMVE